MPTVKTREFKHTGKSGETFAFKEAITVDSKGEFSVNIPEELAGTATALREQPVWKGHVQVGQPRVHWRVQGLVLEQVERFIEEVLKDHLAVDVTEELVIRYRYENNAAGAQAADGTLHPNGHWAQQPGERDSERSWTWAGNSNVHATNRPSLFGVGVVARVYKKITYSRPSGSKIVYSNDLPGSHWDKNPMNRLNDFIVQAPDARNRSSNSAGLMTSGKAPSDGLHEMPYSDAAAIFFADLMIAMLRLGAQLDAFVGDREQLQLAIERGATLLPPPGAGTEKLQG